MSGYVELHARSAFSFLEGGSVPEELIVTGKKLGMPAMALLDRDGVYGAPRFHMATKDTEFKAHIGAEISVQSPKSKSQSNKTIYSIPVLTQTRKGYQNLCRLITLMKMRVPKHARPGECVVTPEELAAHAEGLVCLTGGFDGPLAKEIENQVEQKELQSTTEWLLDVFGKQNVYAELQRHYDREEEARNQVVIEIARRNRLPLLATNGVCYAVPARRQISDVFTCLRNHVHLETAGRLLAHNSERYLKSAEAMQQLFADLPEAVANTVALSSRLDFTLKDLGYEFPKYPVGPGETMTGFLRRRVADGGRWRYTGVDEVPTYEEARPQLERELALIEKLKLEGYFLIVWDIVEFCKSNGILIQGRGSAANSAVCYALGITAVDPIRMKLLFERFLSEERGEWPDIDLDLPSGDQREKAIQYVYGRYGKLGAAMTANVITYRGRSAAREVGKVLDFDDDTLSRLSSLVHKWEWKDPKDSTARQFRDAGLDLSNPRIKKFFQLYLMVQDLPRHLSQHSGGMVICQGQLDSIVPLEPATMPGRVVVQWDKEDCADLGLIKVDLLGLGMMSVLEDSIKLIRESYREEIDLAHLPQDDPAVYSALQKADTIGMFQVESRAQMSCLPRLRPRTFYDIVVQVAIIRPGPIVGNMVHPYLKRRKDKSLVTYAHPNLKPVLERTLGVPLFQEQLLKMAMECAGFSGGEAEELRRAFGFKRSEERMKAIEVKLREGLDKNGILGKTQDEIVQAICSFALYGFPESHAASFALLAYSSAYLKCNYLAAFTAAILNNQPMGFYQPFTLIKDAQRHGLRVLPIDITKSDWLCTLENGGVGDRESGRVGDGVNEEENNLISTPDVVSASPAHSSTPSSCFSLSPVQHVSHASRFTNLLPHPVTPSSNHLTPSSHSPHSSLALRLGLNYVKGLNKESGEAIVNARHIRPFAGIDDLRNRVPQLRKDELRKLAVVGALNFIQETEPVRKAARTKVHRRDALWQVERVVRSAGELYEDLLEQDNNSPLLPMTIPERLNADFRGTGMTIGKHPVAYHRSALIELGALRAIDIAKMRDGIAVRVAGWVMVRQRPGTAKGFMFLSLEDETGISNIIVTPQLFDQYRMVLVDKPFLMIVGALQHQDNVVSVKAQHIEALSLEIAAAPSHDFH
ncbi:MAG TPA: error-prone DNA polymerase [Pyrinomonadaceae bacterium]